MEFESVPPFTTLKAQVDNMGETIDDRVAALLVAGTNITLSYNDSTNKLTINSTASGGTGSTYNIGLFTAAAGKTIPSDVTMVRTSGYAATGDRGEAVYVAVASQPTHPARFQAADGRWFGLAPAQRHTPEMFGAKGDGTTHDEAAINAALAANVVSALYFAPVTYQTNGPILMQANKAMIGAGSDRTIFRRTQYASTDITAPTAMITASAPTNNVTFYGFTLQCNRAGNGMGDSKRCNGLVVQSPNFLAEDIIVDNTTAYAFWAVGALDLVNGAITGGTFRKCKTWNWNVAYEQVGRLSRILILDCEGHALPRDGGAEIANPHEAHFHQYSGGSNVSLINYVGTGGGTGWLPLLNGADIKNITIMDSRFTGILTAPIYTEHNGANTISGVRLIGSSFIMSSTSSSAGVAAKLDRMTGYAIGCEFEGQGAGIYLNPGADMRFTQCTAHGYTPVAGTGVAYGVYMAGGAGVWDGGEIRATGPAGSVAQNGGLKIGTTTRLFPAASATAGPVYITGGLSTIIQDGATSYYLNIAVPVNPASLDKLVFVPSLRRTTGDGYAEQGISIVWAFLDEGGSAIRVRINGGNNLHTNFKLSWYMAEMP